MTNYAKFLEGKQKKHIESGFEINESELKESYYDVVRQNLQSIIQQKSQMSLF